MYATVDNVSAVNLLLTSLKIALPIYHISLTIVQFLRVCIYYN